MSTRKLSLKLDSISSKNILKSIFSTKITPLTTSDRLLNKFSSSRNLPNQIIDDNEALQKRRISRIYDKKMVVILERAIDILLKNPSLRTIEEIYHLIRATDNLEFFSKMKKQKEIDIYSPSSLIYKCCKHLRYEYVTKGEAVFHEGDKAEKFYIIIKGKIAVLLPKDNETLKKEKDLLKKIRTNREIPEYLKAYDHITLSKEKDDVKTNEENVHNDSLVIKKLKKGFSKVSHAIKFLKSIEKSSDNSKSQTHKESQKNKIKSDDSNKLESNENSIPHHETDEKNSIINGLANKEIKNKEKFYEEGVFKYYVVSYLSSGNVFGELALIRKKKRSATIICVENCHFAVLSRKEYDNILQQFYQEKFQSLFNFFSRTIFKKLSKDRLTKIAYMYEKKKILKDQIIFKENDESNECYIIKKGDVELSKLLKPNRLSNSNILKTNNIIKSYIKVCLISVGECFGEEHIIKKKRRNYCAKAISNKVSVYVISKTNFLKILSENTELLNDFKLGAIKKEKWHNSKINQIEKVLFINEKNSSKQIMTLNKNLALANFYNKKFISHKKNRSVPTRLSLEQLDTFEDEYLKKTMKTSEIEVTTPNTPQNSSLFVVKGKKRLKNLTEKQLYCTLTNNFGEIVKNNKKTIRKLQNKKIDIISLYNDTKNVMRDSEGFILKAEKTKISKSRNSLKQNMIYQNKFSPNKKIDKLVKTCLKKNESENEYGCFFTSMKKNDNFLEKKEPKRRNSFNPIKTSEIFQGANLNFNFNFNAKRVSESSLDHKLIVLNHMGRPLIFNKN